LPTLKLELSGEHFKRQYLLYIIELSHKGSSHYYVGQTGDTKEITARPVFRRLAAHLEDRKSTQNQVYQYISHILLKCPKEEGKKIAFSENTRVRVEEFLLESTITFNAYHLQPFKKTTRENHNIARRKTLVIENLVIKLLLNNQKTVINIKPPTNVDFADCPYPLVLQQVARDFKLKVIQMV
jgi:hypothetical protein